MITSKSPVAVALTAYEAAKKAVPAYTHIKSPRKFTQHQLIACLVLKEFFTTDYRGITAILKDSSDLRKALALTEVPHFTTLQKTSKQLFTAKQVRNLIKSILQLAKQKKIMPTKVLLAALDGTGFESRHVSRYFVQRRDRTVKDKYETAYYQRFPKAGIVCDTANHLILAGIPERGPKFDRTHYQSALMEAKQQTSIHTLVADAGYDGEQNHIFARELLGIRTIIPPLAGRKTIKLPTSKYRRLMATHFDRELYGQRWQIETVNSMLKRNLGSFLRAKSYWSQCREIMLRLFTHNVTIVLPTFRN